MQKAKSMNGPAAFEKMSEKIEKEMKRLHVPGASLGILYHGKEYTRGFGINSIENPLPVTAETLFQAGSITKTFTGSVLMNLRERGLIQLDAPVCNYIPGFKMSNATVTKKLTVRQLLTHTGGWVGDYFNNFGDGEDSLRKMLPHIAKLPQVLPLGKIWSYSNTGFNIAAHLIECVTGKAYEVAIGEILLAPLAMEKSFFYPDDGLLVERVAVGHFRKNNKNYVARPWAVGRAANGVGGLVTTTPDLLRFARFHMGASEKILSRSTRKEMRAFQIDAGQGRSMGITWFLEEKGGLKLVHHGGTTNGQQAFFMMIPDSKFALVLLSNSDSSGQLRNKAYSLALELFFHFKEAASKMRNYDGGELAELVGTYEHGIGRFKIEAKKKWIVYHDMPLGGFPLPESPPLPSIPPVRFSFSAKDILIAMDDPIKGTTAEVLRNSAGKVEFIRVFSRAHKRVG